MVRIFVYKSSDGLPDANGFTKFCNDATKARAIIDTDGHCYISRDLCVSSTYYTMELLHNGTEARGITLEFYCKLSGATGLGATWSFFELGSDDNACYMEYCYSGEARELFRFYSNSSEIAQKFIELPRNEWHKYRFLIKKVGGISKLYVYIDDILQVNGANIAGSGSKRIYWGMGSGTGAGGIWLDYMILDRNGAYIPSEKPSDDYLVISSKLKVWQVKPTIEVRYPSDAYNDFSTAPVIIESCNIHYGLDRSYASLILRPNSSCYKNYGNYLRFPVGSQFRVHIKFKPDIDYYKFYGYILERNDIMASRNGTMLNVKLVDGITLLNNLYSNKLNLLQYPPAYIESILDDVDTWSGYNNRFISLRTKEKGRKPSEESDVQTSVGSRIGAIISSGVLSNTDETLLDANTFRVSASTINDKGSIYPAIRYWKQSKSTDYDYSLDFTNIMSCEVKDENQYASSFYIKGGKVIRVQNAEMNAGIGTALVDTAEQGVLAVTDRLKGIKTIKVGLKEPYQFTLGTRFLIDLWQIGIKEYATLTAIDIEFAKDRFLQTLYLNTNPHKLVDSIRKLVKTMVKP